MTGQALQKLEQEASGFPGQAKLIVVHNEHTLILANHFLLDIKTIRKKIADTFDPIIDKAYKTHKEAVAQKKKYELPLIEAEKMVKLQIASYMDEQKRLAREAEEKARKEEEERQRIEQEKFEEARRLEAVGEMEEAEKVKNEIPLPKPFVPPTTPKLTGASISKIPKWRLVNINLVPREYLIPDSEKITRIVKSTSGQVQIPGIQIYFEDVVSASAK